jgi:hypothetical protein
MMVVGMVGTGCPPYVLHANRGVGTVFPPAPPAHLLAQFHPFLRLYCQSLAVFG